jgi:hypothetical protein
MSVKIVLRRTFEGKTQKVMGGGGLNIMMRSVIICTAH